MGCIRRQTKIIFLWPKSSPYETHSYVKKLIRGIVDFRKNVRPAYKDTFAELALGQNPDTLFICCSDSRVAPNVFASTDPGDLFVVRNVGNLIPPSGEPGQESGGAAIEFALTTLPVKQVIICGHSECGAMKALVNHQANASTPNLKNWLKNGELSLEKLDLGATLNPNLNRHNQLSQLNVLEQMKHLLTYPAVKNRIDAGELRVHGWWFDIKEAEVYEYEPSENRFVLIDEAFSQVLLKRFPE